MKETGIKNRIYFIITLLSGLTVFISAQPEAIGLGWAKTSVNAKVFTKNAVTSFEGMQYTAFYDSTGNVILGKRELGSDTWDTSKTQYTGDVTDAHNTINIGIDGAGYLHMAWNHHNSDLQYCMSLDSGSIEMGEKKIMIGNNENNVTYPEFSRMPNGDLMFIYRNGESGNGDMVINKYILETKTWVRLHDVLIDGENQRNAYWQSFVDINGIIHVSWVWRDTWDASTNHDICYAKSSDGGETWYKSTGEQYSLPITAATAEYAVNIGTGRELINQTSMYADSNGIPYIATYYKPAGKTKPQYHLIYLTDSSGWKAQQISNRKTDFSLSGGGTLQIPIARPQILVDDRNDKPLVYLLYRDSERGSKVSLNVCNDLDTNHWIVYDITDFSVDNWEPTYDIDLWKDSMELNIFVQNVAQGNNETQVNRYAQPVYILGIPDDLVAADTIDDYAEYKPPVGIKNIKLQEINWLYPNPALNEIVIQGDDNYMYVDILDIRGNLIYDKYIHDFPLKIDITTLSGGIYFVRLHNNKGINKVTKFIKK